MFVRQFSSKSSTSLQAFIFNVKDSNGIHFKCLMHSNLQAVGKAFRLWARPSGYGQGLQAMGKAFRLWARGQGLQAMGKAFRLWERPSGYGQGLQAMGKAFRQWKRPSGYRQGRGGYERRQSPRFQCVSGREVDYLSPRYVNWS